MPFGLWIVLLLVPAVTEAQSGDAQSDIIEPRISCTSHISQVDVNSITCDLDDNSNDNEDDEDEESDEIHSMTVCIHKLTDYKLVCVERLGNTVRAEQLFPITAPFNVTVQLKSGSKILKILDLQKIVKPKSPELWNATFDPKSNKAEIHIRSTSHQDYLQPNDLLLQFHIWSPRHTMIRNITSQEPLIIGGEYLQKNAEYHVKARAIPNGYFEGTWSEWSATLNFSTHINKTEPKESPVLLYNLTVAFVTLLLVVWSIFFFWKKKIYTYMWPSIPHPKHTLVQIYKPVKELNQLTYRGENGIEHLVSVWGLPGTFNPETFSDLKIYPVDKIEEQHPGEAEHVAADDIAKLKDPCLAEESSGQTSDSSRSNTSITTEVSMLLSQSSSGGEDDPQSRTSSPVGVLQLGQGQDPSNPAHNTGRNYPEMYAITQQGKDEAYVTMSSFYQIK